VEQQCTAQLSSDHKLTGRRVVLPEHLVLGVVGIDDEEVGEVMQPAAHTGWEGKRERHVRATLITTVTD